MAPSGNHWNSLAPSVTVWHLSGSVWRRRRLALPDGARQCQTLPEGPRGLERAPKGRKPEGLRQPQMAPEGPKRPQRAREGPSLAPEGSPEGP